MECYDMHWAGVGGEGCYILWKFIALLVKLLAYFDKKRCPACLPNLVFTACLPSRGTREAIRAVCSRREGKQGIYSKQRAIILKMRFFLGKSLYEELWDQLGKRE